MFQRREQKGAETSAFRAETGEIVFPQKAREEGLHEIFRIRLGVTAPPHVGVERKPIGAAELSQRVIGLRRVLLPGSKHDRPMRRGEDVARRAG